MKREHVPSSLFIDLFIYHYSRHMGQNCILMGIFMFMQLESKKTNNQSPRKLESLAAIDQPEISRIIKAFQIHQSSTCKSLQCVERQSQHPPTGQVTTLDLQTSHNVLMYVLMLEMRF